MKRLFILPVLALAVACQNSPKNEEAKHDHTSETVQEEAAPVMAMFGAEISEDGAVDVAMLPEKMAGADSVNIKVEGKINEVCQVKGCWMTMNVGEESMRVSFRDYGFFVPKDADGNEVIMEGTAYIDTTSVADLKHYAQDAGKSQEEIDAITEPEVALQFVADGVIIKDYVAKEEMEEEAHDHGHDHEEEHAH